MTTRNPRQCRERWTNYVNPLLKQGNWTYEEDRLLEAKFARYGTKWKTIAQFFTNRSDISLRNRHDMIARRLKKVSHVRCKQMAEPPARENDVIWKIFPEEEEELF
jgi:hypothetical protein